MDSEDKKRESMEEEKKVENSNNNETDVQTKDTEEIKEESGEEKVEENRGEENKDNSEEELSKEVEEEKSEENENKENQGSEGNKNGENGEKVEEKEEYVKGPGKAKQKTIKMDSDEDERGTSTKSVELEDTEPVKKIRDIEREKGEQARSRRRKIVQDGDDAYSYRNRGILQDAKWRPDKYAEHKQKLDKEKGLTVYDKMRMARKENPILKKRIEDDMESSRPDLESMDDYLNKLRKQRKSHYYDDEDLYGSDESDTEERMRKVHKTRPLPAEKINETMEERRARILKQMTQETERIDEEDRRKEAARREQSRKHDEWSW